MPSETTLKSAIALIVASACISRVAAHGAMTCPPSRYGIGMPNNDHQRQPINLRPSVFPQSYGMAPMIPCGGLFRSQSKLPATSVYAGQQLHVAWEMGLWTGAALHQGTVVISLSHGGDDAGPWTKLGEVSFVGLSTVDASPHYGTFTLPSDLKVGDMASLQFNWTASVTPELYYNCADLVIVNKAGYTDPACVASTSSGLAAPSNNNNQQSYGAAQVQSNSNAQQPIANAPNPAQNSPSGQSSGSVVAGHSCDQSKGAFACAGPDTAQCGADGIWYVTQCPGGTACDSRVFVCAYADPAKNGANVQQPSNTQTQQNQQNQQNQNNQQDQQNQQNQQNPQNQPNQQSKPNQQNSPNQQQGHTDPSPTVTLLVSACPTKATTVRVTVTHTVTVTTDDFTYRRKRDNNDL